MPCVLLLSFDVRPSLVQLVESASHELFELIAGCEGADVGWVETQVVHASTSVRVVEPASCKLSPKII
jgi:hypothetical protein